MGVINEIPLKNLSVDDKLDALLQIVQSQQAKIDMLVESVNPGQKTLLMSDIVKQLGLPKNYVYEFIKKGLLKTFNDPNRKKVHYWTTQDELDRFIEEDLTNYNYGKEVHKKVALTLANKKSKAA